MLWPYSLGSGGYGSMSWEGRTRSVHSVACELAHGPRPSPLHEVGHAPIICHNRACFNPFHLRWVTRVENAADSLLDGTAPRGERFGGAKLTGSQVRIIRERYKAGGVTQIQLGLEYGVSTTNVCAVIHGKTWGWLT